MTAQMENRKDVLFNQDCKQASNMLAEKIPESTWRFLLFVCLFWENLGVWHTFVEEDYVNKTNWTCPSVA